jgi:RNA polymerase sigma factor (sigma-70 family)
MIRTVAQDRRDGESSDQDLLRRFAAERDAAAFQAILGRHGPMVLGVCRGVLGRETDAEDAFQATFLALTSQAGSIRKAHSLGSWLHGVAYRTSLKAKSRAAARRRYETHAARPAAVDESGPSWREVQETLHEELDRLPECYRAALVACYLEGKTQEQAARQLGIGRTTLKDRLERGRELLRTRLSRRGLGPAALLAASAWPGATASACVPAELFSATVKTVTAAAEIPTGGVAKSMFIAKLRAGAIPVAAVFVAAALVVGVGVFAHQSAADQPPAEGQAVQPRRAAARANGSGDPLPAGAVARMGTARLRHGSNVYTVVFLPDGKQLLSAAEDGTARLWDVATGKEVRSFGGEAHSAALAPDGKTLAMCDDDDVSLIDVATGREKGMVKDLKATLNASVAALAFSPDGKTLAAAGPAGPVAVCDIAGGDGSRRLVLPEQIAPPEQIVPAVRNLRLRLYSKIEHNVRRPSGPGGAGQGVWSERERPHLAFSRDGKKLLAATLGFNGRSIRPAVTLLEVATGKELFRLDAGDNRLAVSAALSTDGKAIAWVDQSAAGGGNVHLTEVATGKELHHFPATGAAHLAVEPDGKLENHFLGAGTRFAFALDGRTLVTGSVGGQVVVWDSATGKELRRLGKSLPAPTFSYGVSYLAPPGLAISADGKLLAAPDGNAIALFDLATGRELHTRDAHRTAVIAVRYAADGKTLTSIDGDGTSCIREAATGKAISRARLPDGMLKPVLSSDGQTLASAGLDGKVRFTDAATGQDRGAIQTSARGALRLAIAPDGKMSAVGTWASPTVVLYDVTTGKETRVLKPDGEEDLKPRGFAVIPFRIAPPPVFSPDGKRLAAQGRHALHLWDVGTGKEIQRIDVPEDRAVGQAVFAPDGRSVALDMLDGPVALFEMATGKQLRSYASKPAVIPSRPLGGPPGTASPLGEVDPTLLAFSPDGRTFAHSRDRDVVVWDADSGEELGRLHGHAGFVFAGAFAPDGKTLATASGDTTVLVWDVTALSHAAKKTRRGE